MKIFSGKHRGRKLFSPKGDARPSSGRLREALFNILGPAVEGMHVLDLFAGTGAIGIEALSRGAASVTFVERQPEILRKNLSLLGLDQRILACDVFSAVERLDQSFDLIFADPPYGEGLGEALVRTIDQTSILNGMLFIEESELEVAPLNSLEFERVRAYGKSKLYQFRRIV